MNLSVRQTGPWERTLEIEVPVDEVDRRLDEVARQIQRRASLPGFRKGKVPLELVRQHFADTVEQEFLESFVPRVTSEAMDQERLNPVVTPEVRNLRFTPGQPLRFEAVVEVRPEVEVKDYKALPARRQVRPVDEAAVDQVLAAQAKLVADYRAGKEKAFNALVGQVMKATQGKANPAQVNEILKRRLAG
jgi:trigger factor